MKHFDYIFTGSGLSALMIVYKMVQSGKFNDKSMLLLDENPKKTNDRTWCFWEESNGTWETIIHKKWNSALFADENFRRGLDLKPYRYNMVKGLDFYNLVFDLISKQKNITFFSQKVIEIEESENLILIQTDTESFSCSKLLNSIYNKQKAESQTEYPVLQQHFIGWFIKSEQPVFNPGQATFMDFSVEQRGNTRFMYVLPTSKTEALIEYTLFSKNLLQRQEYETEIQKYIQNLGITNYEIIEKEQGSIPMTCYPFWEANTKNVINIGTSGGWTKASTGYTFKYSDKKSTELVLFLQTETDFKKFHKTTKFWFYDLLLLDILDRKNEIGSTIFSSLFKKGSPKLIFKFLDEETSLLEDIQVILKCPKTPFIQALLHVAFRKIK
ncbi:lycopene cyclase family protein [Flavobacterium gawalongense]|uniref:Lycopene cyclase n=1 Tax=Flavobacterium gawalongense TaxID=2594432 RepID=A0A553BK35_9FLAO|nr:lycopene cyclase family protein [Flavobacterium gawalongense]TRX00333.1 lycopene cyclase [Flavobacterium gawalongense]TRX08391.1 lycopene cyclase [Flavobacterium gawalongense]TRX08613.1 lycopene cyclase [Flavobacterium gawalongense]TRX09596.1 lycopene cyclase [Flavobacterium gawalongense]TRX25605.1 lycopene cyclase [Flavobacterium gawalongense]